MIYKSITTEDNQFREDIKNALAQLRSHHPEYTITDKEAMSFAVRLIPLVGNRITKNEQNANY